jgi:hypothetical protein
MGRELMPWQQGVLDVALEHDGHGHLVYPLVCCTVPRQQGKSALVQAVAAWGCLRAPNRLVLHTAQTRNDARDRWAEGVSALQDSGLAGTLDQVYRGVGLEQARFRNRSVWRVFSPTEDAAHGASVDVAILDEAWALGERILQAVIPATQTRRDPQVWLISTAGTDESTMLRRHVEMGRVGSPDLAYFEWSAPDNWPAAEPATWRACMPALGLTVEESHVAHAQATLPAGSFDRAYLNRWTVQLESVIPPAWWAACRQAESQLPYASPLALAADVALDRGQVAIAAAGLRPDGRLHVELVDAVAGTDAAPRRLLELAYRHSAVVLAVSGDPHAAELVAGLHGLGVEPATYSGARLAAACAHLYDLVRQGKLAHRGQPALDAAVAGAGRRLSGDSWSWSRRSSRADIAPLVAVTLAAWALVQSPTPGYSFG